MTQIHFFTPNLNNTKPMEIPAIPILGAENSEVLSHQGQPSTSL